MCFFKTNSEIDILATQLLGIERGRGRSLTFNKAVLQILLLDSVRGFPDVFTQHIEFCEIISMMAARVALINTDPP